MAYKYITDNNLYEKQTYMYSEYKGVDFIKEYLNSRQTFLNCSNGAEGYCGNVEMASNPVRQELLEIRKNLKQKKSNKQIMNLVNAYTKSFEVRKRIYTNYNSDWRPLENADFEDYESYLLFADCLLLAYQNTKCLKYFSCLLKVNDSLLSIQDKLRYQFREYFCQIIGQELNIFFQLSEENGIHWEAVK